MGRDRENQTLLGAYRALDLTDERGFLCGRLLADLGMDVIKVEKPGGDRARNVGPFYRDVPDPEKSLYWFAFNANKRGISLNLEQADGRELFRTMVSKADVVIESFAPGYLESLGLGYASLSRLNPGIVIVSISPFGQTGPYGDYKASDLVVTALSGYLTLCGDPDRAPVRIGFPQAYLHACADAASGVVTALYQRGLTGEGDHIDAAAQASMAHATMDTLATWTFLGMNVKRVGSKRVRPGSDTITPAIFECKDGYVYFVLYGGLVGARGNQALMDWMDSDGLATDFLRGIDWTKFDLYAPHVDQNYIDRIMGPLGEFFKRHTKKELFQGGIQRHIMVFPLNDTKDLTEDPQLAARQYWAELEHRELGDRITYPGPFVKLSATPVRLGRRAPLIGEHNEEIYVGELSLSREKVLYLKEIGVI